ncbi:DUF397 domain-containing protein [Streptomyces sp. NPDC005017]|uniref:DUF397 domain-containing protein n=1 Tax=Streptomyces sp. NPDC005017 TaxID=3364706 RepID=UPI003693137A
MATWVKSSHSGANGGDCLEFAPEFGSVVPVRDSKNPDGPVLTIGPTAWAAFTSSWKKSSYSDANGGNCLEVAPEFGSVVPVRDSKNPDGPVLTIGPTAWAAFTSALR